MPAQEQTTTEVVIREDADDPIAWEIVHSFEKAPTKDNTEAVLRLLDEKLQRWNSHPPGLITTILEAMARHRVGLGRAYALKFLDPDTTLPSSTHIASYAAMALGELGGDGAFEGLAQAAQHGPDEMLDSVAVALGLLQDRRGITLLETLAGHPEPEIRVRALEALAKFCSTSSTPLVIKFLTDSNNRVRNGATWWLAQCATDEDAERLAKALADVDELVRANALKGLIRLNNRAGCGNLSSLLTDKSATVRETARTYEHVCHG